MTTTTTTTTTTDIGTSQAVADAIVRALCLDDIVVDYEFDAERGHLYFFDDGNVLKIESTDDVRFTDANGAETTTHYASSDEMRGLTFKIIGDDNGLLDMYQHGTYIASEPIN